MTRLALVIVAGLWACNSAPKVDSCADDVSGVWRGDDGRRYHALAERGRVDLYPMFNAARREAGVDYAPYMFGFARSGAQLVGERVQRATHKRNTCRLRTRATVACGDNTLVLRYDAIDHIDWARCRARRTRSRTLTLKR